MNNNPRSRRLTTYEFFQVLQIECLVAELRCKIYPKDKDKEYWRKVIEGKRKVIEEIAERNHGLPTIFFDTEMKRELEARIYQNSIPDFHYKDEAQRNKLEIYDLTYYFKAGTDVKCTIFADSKIGNIKKYHPYGKTAIVVIKDTQEELEVPIVDIRRIL